MSKGHKSQPERSLEGPSWSNLNNKIHKGILDYKAKYKISMHESIQI